MNLIFLSFTDYANETKVIESKLSQSNNVDLDTFNQVNHIRLLFVELFKILAVSFISTKKVDSPPAKLSDAPTLVNNLSMIEILALLQGT